MSPGSEAIEFRPFCNSDPPRLIRLWQESRLGRGAAQGIPSDLFDLFVLAAPYFDPQGLIVACAGSQVIGLVHAGFGGNADGTQLAYEDGVICCVLVHPDYRRRGIGRQLVARAEAYLRERGAQRLYAGESAPRNPFYFGIYGSSESVGFLESDPLAQPFFTALGYQPCERFIVLERDLIQRKDPFDPRLLTLRRKAQLEVIDHPPDVGWWWMTRQGRPDSFGFVLTEIATSNPLGIITCWGMDLHSQTWQQRTVGLMDMRIENLDRRKGFGKLLLIEIFRRLREELITHVQIASRDSNEAAIGLFRSVGFEPIDTGIVYQRPTDA